MIWAGHSYPGSVDTLELEVQLKHHKSVLAEAVFIFHFFNWWIWLS